MTNPAGPRPVTVLALAAAFAVAHTQAPLFYQNQNQYLLHGLAAAGYGHLEHDWLANTKDPTPLFSAGVELAYRVAGLWPLHAAYFLLVMGYFVAAWRLVAVLPGRPPTGSEPGPVPAPGGAGYSVLSTQYLLRFAALFTAAHAAIFRLASVWLTGVDYPWYLQSGVAGQYILGPGLQPSAFGVLLVGSLAAFAGGRPYLAAGLGAGAAVLHVTYLLPAALFTLGYMTALAAGGRTRTGVGVGALSLAVVAPTIVFTLVTFPPTTPETFGAAQEVLARVRIPHHAVVSRWLDVIAVLQMIWIGAGIWAARNTRLFLPLLVAAGGGAVLTLLQVVMGSDTLALMFPWRVSAVLVPVTTAILAAKLVGRLPAGRTTDAVFAGLPAVSVVGGVVVMALGLGYRVNEAEVPVLGYVREHGGPGDVYLIPTRIPDVAAGRGSVSTSFTPPPRPKPGSNLIPIDLQRFRLATGAPIFVDFKSIPYLDTEVLEWYRRMQLAEEWYAEPEWDRAGVQEQLKAKGITHVVIPRHQAIRAGFLEMVYADDAYAVYRVR